MVRPVAILKLSKRPQAVLVFADHVIASMTGNPYFPTPKPSLTSLASQVDALRRAETATLSRTVGTREARDARHVAVREGLKQLCAHVQTVANAHRPLEAAALIKSSGLFLKSRAGRGKQVLSARSGSESGTVRLTAAFAGKVALYEWAYSLDQQTWVPLPSTTVAKTLAESLTPGIVHYFRTRALRRAGMGNWSNPIAFIVS